MLFCHLWERGNVCTISVTRLTGIYWLRYRGIRHSRAYQLKLVLAPPNVAHSSAADRQCTNYLNAFTSVHRDWVYLRLQNTVTYLVSYFAYKDAKCWSFVVSMSLSLPVRQLGMLVLTLTMSRARLLKQRKPRDTSLWMRMRLSNETASNLTTPVHQIHVPHATVTPVNWLYAYC